MQRRSALLTMAALAALLATLLPAGLALAHDGRPVAGRYQFVVGFLTEPAIAGQMNGLELRVTIPSENNKPAEGLEKTLKAEVIVGGGARTMPLELQSRFGQPGAYAAYFMPTREGSYIFRITGTIEGAPVDERFESGPGRFNDVQALAPLQFPDQLPNPVAAANELKAAREEAAAARTLALAGLVAAVAGLLAAGAALATRRRPALEDPRGAAGKQQA